MNTRIQTDIWISHIVVVIGLFLVASAVGIIVLILIGKPIPEILVAPGSVAMGGLARLLVPSPLNQWLFD